MWLNSKDFAENNKIKIKTVRKSIERAKNKGKKFCRFKLNILCFMYVGGVGGGGKVLKIWSEPFATEAEAQAFINGNCASATSTAPLENVEDFSKAGIEEQNFALN